MRSMYCSTRAKHLVCLGRKQKKAKTSLRHKKTSNYKHHSNTTQAHDAKDREQVQEAKQAKEATQIKATNEAKEMAAVQHEGQLRTATSPRDELLQLLHVKILLMTEVLSENKDFEVSVEELCRTRRLASICRRRLSQVTSADDVSISEHWNLLACGHTMSTLFAHRKSLQNTDHLAKGILTQHTDLINSDAVSAL